VRSNAPLTEVLRAAGDTAQMTLPVVDDAGGLVGLIVTHDLVAMLSSEADVVGLVNALDICRRNTPVVSGDSISTRPRKLMESEDLEELPVVESIAGQSGPPPHRYHRAQGDRPGVEPMAVSLSTLASTGTSIFWADRLSPDAHHRAADRRGQDDGGAGAAHALRRERASRYKMRTSRETASSRLRPTASSNPAIPSWPRAARPICAASCASWSNCSGPPVIDPV